MIRIFSRSTIAIAICLSSFFAFQLSAQTVYRQPKNIIIMIGDGMGWGQLTVGSIYKFGTEIPEYLKKFDYKYYLSTYPAKAGKKGEDEGLDWSKGYAGSKAWENFEWIQSGYTCSSASGTALATGVKTTNGFVGLNVDGKRLVNISELAKTLGKSAGVVTTVQISHATPATFVAHNLSRNNFSEIAREMILDSKMDLVMGAGNPMFDDSGNQTTNPDYKYVGGESVWNSLKAGSTEIVVDGKKSIMKDVNSDGTPDKWQLIQTKDEFEALASSKKPPLRVLGIAQVFETLQQKRGSSSDEKYDSKNGKENAYVVPFNQNLPNLSIMTKGAINTLSQNPNGFFLMIEGGAIDWACHSNQPGRLIEEWCDFSDAIESMIRWVETNSSWDETLLIVTADHETGFITGTNFDEKTVSFGEITNNGKGQMPSFVFHTGKHTNSLVPFFAKGAGANIFENFADETDKVRGPYIQNSEVGSAMKLLWGNWK